MKDKGIDNIDIVLNYPVLHNYFQTFLPEIETRSDKGKHWTNLRNCAYLDEFEKPKIVWGEISDRSKFTYIDENIFIEATSFLMTGNNLKYLLAMLNSKLLEWYFNQIGTATGVGTNRWKKYTLELLPIAIPTKVIQLKIEKIVDQILKNTNETIQSPDIESIVCELYNLSDEEKKFILAIK